MIAIVFSNSTRKEDIKAALSASEAVREFIALHVRHNRSTEFEYGPRSYTVMQSMAEDTFDAMSTYLNRQLPEENMVITYLYDINPAEITPENVSKQTRSPEWLSLLCKAKLIVSAEQGPMHIDNKWSSMTSSTTVFLNKIPGNCIYYKELVAFLKERNIVCEGSSDRLVETLQAKLHDNDLPGDLELETREITPLY